jgi:Zn-dependent alcohol dehydrogenase
VTGVQTCALPIYMDPIITHEIPLADFERGFDLMAKGEAIKVILNLE